MVAAAGIGAGEVTTVLDHELKCGGLDVVEHCARNGIQLAALGVNCGLVDINAPACDELFGDGNGGLDTDRGEEWGECPQPGRLIIEVTGGLD